MICCRSHASTSQPALAQSTQSTAGPHNLVQCCAVILCCREPGSRDRLHATHTLTAGLRLCCRPPVRLQHGAVPMGRIIWPEVMPNEIICRIPAIRSTARFTARSCGLCHSPQERCLRYHRHVAHMKKLFTAAESSAASAPSIRYLGGCRSFQGSCPGSIIHHVMAGCQGWAYYDVHDCHMAGWEG